MTLRESATDISSTRVPRVANLGDAIQTYALCRLLPATTAVYRDRLASMSNGPPAVINGYLNTEPPLAEAVCVFAGIHVERGRHDRPTCRWAGGSRSRVSARDPATHRRLTSRGVPAVMVGCATLTLEQHRGPRSGMYSVDYLGPDPGKACQRLTHTIPADFSWPDQWRRAGEFVHMYRTAAVVYTSRLHVACLV